jgi:hypothetical protein
MSISLYEGRESKRLHFKLIIIGTGGTGSHFFRSLCQDIATYRKREVGKFYETLPFDYTIYIVDEDKVESKNLNNQLFDKEDVNEYKVFALNERYGEHYSLGISAVPQYVTSIEMLETLFSDCNENHVVPVLCGMVDNDRSRQLFHEFFHSEFLSELIYLDAGIEGVLLKEQVSEQPAHIQEKWIRDSGFSGQVVIGYKRGGDVIMPPVADVYPTIMMDQESVFPNQSCGDAILKNPQRGETNKMAAQMSNNIVNNLLHSGLLFQNEITFNAQFSTSQAKFVSKQVEQEYKKLFKERDKNGTTFSAIS